MSPNGHPLPRLFIVRDLITALLLTTSPALIADNGSFRWVDDEGEVHYSDTLPPNARISPHSRIDGSGRVIESFDATIDEIDDVAENQTTTEKNDEKDDQKAAATEHTAKSDRTLLRTFGNKRDIRITRDQRLGGVDTQIMLLERKIDRLERHHATLKERYAEAEGQDHNQGQSEARLEELDERIAKIEARLNRQERSLTKQRERRAEIETTFERYLQRFGELKAQRADKD